MLFWILLQFARVEKIIICPRKIKNKNKNKMNFCVWRYMIYDLLQEVAFFTEVFWDFLMKGVRVLETLFLQIGFDILLKKKEWIYLLWFFSSLLWVGFWSTCHIPWSLLLDGSQEQQCKFFFRWIVLSHSWGFFSFLSFFLFSLSFQKHFKIIFIIIWLGPLLIIPFTYSPSILRCHKILFHMLRFSPGIHLQLHHFHISIPYGLPQSFLPLGAAGWSTHELRYKKSPHMTMKSVNFMYILCIGVDSICADFCFGFWKGKEFYYSIEEF